MSGHSIRERNEKLKKGSRLDELRGSLRSNKVEPGSGPSAFNFVLRSKKESGRLFKRTKQADDLRKQIKKEERRRK